MKTKKLHLEITPTICYSSMEPVVFEKLKFVAVSDYTAPLAHQHMQGLINYLIFLLGLLAILSVGLSGIIVLFAQQIKRANKTIDLLKEKERNFNQQQTAFNEKETAFISREKGLQDQLKKKEFREQLTPNETKKKAKEETERIDLWEKLQHPINNVLNSDDWEKLQLAIDTTYNDYTSRLKMYCPALNKSDFRLIYLIKAERDTTEISYLLSISSSNVGTKKHRLKMKLNLNEDEQSLDDFIKKF